MTLTVDARRLEHNYLLAQSQHSNEAVPTFRLPLQTGAAETFPRQFESCQALAFLGNLKCPSSRVGQVLFWV